MEKSSELFGQLNVLYLVAESCPTLCDPMDNSPPVFSVHGDAPGKNTGVGCNALFRGSSQPRDQTGFSYTAGRFFTSWAPGKVLHHIGIIINSVSSPFPLPPGDRRRGLKVPIMAWSFWWQTPIQEPTKTRLIRNSKKCRSLVSELGSKTKY